MGEEYRGLTEYIEAEEPELLDRVGSQPIKATKNERSRLVSALLRAPEDRRMVFDPGQAPHLVEGDVDVVVHMGCHVIQTPHIVDATVDLLASLDLTVVPLGGFNNCCGSLDIRQGTFDDAERVDDARFRNVETFDPDYLITECTSCFARTARFSSRYRSFEGYEFLSMVEFLLDRRGDIVDRIEIDEPVTVAFHDHYDPTQWTPTRQCELSRELFEALPGVETVEMTHGLDERLPCNFLADPAEYGVEDLTATVYEEATAAGADVLINFWHACHRNMVPYDERSSVRTKNYATFLAERLGFSYRDKTREYKLAAMAREVDWILEDAREAYEANGLTTAEARAVIEDHLAPGRYGPFEPA